MRKHLKFVALCLVAGLALWWFARGMNWAEASEAMRRADWRLVTLGVALICLTCLIRAFRWKTLLRPLAPDASLREIFAATCVGFGAIFLLGRMGEIVRPAFLPLRDRAVRPSAAFVTIALERVCDTAAVILIFAANLLLLRLPGVDAATFARVRQAGLVLFACAVVGLGALVWFGRHADAVTARLDAWLVGRPRPLQKLGGIVSGLLRHLGRTLSVLSGGRGLLATAGWTALLWATITLANMLVLRAFGVGVGPVETVFVLGWSLVGSVVPTPGGGAGTFHMATAAGLTRYLGFPDSQVQPAVIVLHFVVFGSPIIFGLYYFLRSGFSVARLRELIAEEEAEAEAEGRADATPREAGAAQAAGA
ncbi:MAG TPA: lysylphosphatidylglycerol synthase transmembrane domain-containing protein [Pyrinomonadaceae bacterium]|nr:lysylphosphatidylglycerol synthase transmembrane domain-containing protein [Pyrinomonadaceae bacterium]